MWSGKWRPFCLGLNKLTIGYPTTTGNGFDWYHGPHRNQIWQFPGLCYQVLISKGDVNALCAKFFRGNIKHIFAFYVIPPHWYDTGDWNPPSNKTRTYPFYIVNIMTAGVLATQRARTSAAMILTKLNWDNSVPARQGLRSWGNQRYMLLLPNLEQKLLWHGVGKNECEYFARIKLCFFLIFYSHTPVRQSVCLSVNLSCPSCSIYSSGWILSIFGTNDQ